MARVAGGGTLVAAQLNADALELTPNTRFVEARVAGGGALVAAQLSAGALELAPSGFSAPARVAGGGPLVAAQLSADALKLTPNAVFAMPPVARAGALVAALSAGALELAPSGNHGRARHPPPAPLRIVATPGSWRSRWCSNRPSMRIVIAGGTGFLGEPLTRRLVARGVDVVVLSRNPAKVRAGRGVAWDGRTQGGWSEEVAGADAVINLAGENVGEGRWTEERKKQLTASRLDATHAVVEALRNAPRRERTLINASAVGYYGLRGDELLDEHASRGGGFLAKLVEQWERAAREAEPLARLVLLRFGVALAADGGALAKMMLPFKLGVGGRVGSGEQWMSWVDRDDVLRAIEWALDHPTARGVYNVTAPEPVRNRDFTRALGRALHRPTLFPVPAFALRTAFGQMADEVLLGGQRAVPRRPEDEGFVFEARTIDEALARQLTKKK